MHDRSEPASSLPETPHAAGGVLTDGLQPAALALAFGLATVWLRPPLPIDETRYLQVFHESLAGNPLLLRLCGEPYTEKTPLLFWLGRALTWLGLSPDVALRCVPAIASALVVLLVARVGARLGARLAGWVQAAMCLPFLTSQMLIFDSLLALGVWAAMYAWVRRRDGAFAAASAFALLAKGPVALLFLVPFAWILSSARGPRSVDLRRAALLLVVALVPLAAWVAAAAVAGGREFAEPLLWERWGGRIGGAAHHSRGPFFYIPVVLIGALPTTALFFVRARTSAPEWVRRTAWALGSVLLAFTLIRGKQLHYLVPAAPALALLAAWRLGEGERALRALRLGVRVQLTLVAVLALAVVALLPRIADSSFTDHGRALVETGPSRTFLALAAASALTALALTFTSRRRTSASRLLRVALVGAGASLVPFHHVAGELLYPHALARSLGSAPGKVAYMGTSHHGLYALLAPTTPTKLVDDAELAAWCDGEAGRLLVIDPRERPRAFPAPLTLAATDIVHREPVEVWRLDAPEHGLASH